jgi:hypothetical protein
MGNTNQDAEGYALNILSTFLSTLMMARMKTAFFGGHIARWLKNLLRMPTMS